MREAQPGQNNEQQRESQKVLGLFTRAGEEKKSQKEEKAEIHTTHSQQAVGSKSHEQKIIKDWPAFGF